MDIGPEDATTVVVAAFSETPDPRLHEVVVSLTEHLHAFVREVDPTMAEWETVVDYLTRVGHTCDDTRQEFMLLSDVFGITNLVETLESRRTNLGATATTVLGPFHMTESPTRELGDSIDEVGSSVTCVVEGQVTSVDGAPLPGAAIDVWQADDHGFYDVQLVGKLPSGTGRGLFNADDKGQFWFRTVKPAPYPIPTDGPVGELLTLTSRHPNRPAHIHFIVGAPGYHSVTTHAFVADSDYIESDAVFAVKSSLLVDFVTVDDQRLADQFGVQAPFHHARFDITLAPLQPRA